MAIYVKDLAGALMFMRWTPHELIAGSRPDPNYKDGFIRNRAGSAINPDMATRILESGTIPKHLLGREFKVSEQERIWINAALDAWKQASFGKFEKLYSEGAS